MPTYDYNDFKNACGASHTDVLLIGKSQETAREHFNLSTKQEVLDFISNDGLEDLNFVNTKEWEQNPDKANPVMVDAYEFQSMYKLGYIAFMQSLKTGKWIVKSFKLSDYRNRAMEIAIRKAGFSPAKGENNE